MAGSEAMHATGVLDQIANTPCRAARGTAASRPAVAAASAISSPWTAQLIDELRYLHRGSVFNRRAGADGTRLLDQSHDEHITRAGPRRRGAATTCTLDCPDTCSLAVTVTDGRITNIDAAPENPFTDGWICSKVKRHAQRVYAPERVLTPLIRTGAKGSGEFREATWHEALDADRRPHARGDRQRGPRRGRRLHLQLVGGHDRAERA